MHPGPRAVVVPLLLCLFGVLSAAGGVWGEAFRIDAPPDCEEQSLDVAALPGEGLVAVWQAGATSTAGSTRRIFARLFDANHVPLGDPFQVNSGGSPLWPAVAVRATGDFLIAWMDVAPGRLVVRHFNAAGGATGPEIGLSSEVPGGGVAVTAMPAGFALVAIQQDHVRLWRLGPTGSPLSPAELVTTVFGIPEDDPFVRDPDVAYSPSGLVVAWAEDHFGATTVSAAVRTATATEFLPVQAFEQLVDDPLTEPAVAVDGAGRILVAWNEWPPQEGVLRAQVFGPDLAALGPPFRVNDEASQGLGFSAPDATGTPGGFVIAWQSLYPFPGGVAGATWLRRIEAGAAVGPPVQVEVTSSLSRPSVTIDGQDRVTVGWQAGVFPSTAPAAPFCFSDGLYAESPDVSPEGLLLQDGRFEARIHWTDHAGSSGEGRAVSLTGDSGYFWFFGPDNVEVMVKVLDGRRVNGSFWVFYGSLSDVAYTLTVTDRVTGLTKTYVNPAGQLASRGDTLAFPAASASAAPVTAGLAVAPQPSHVPRAEGGEGPCASPQVPGPRRPGLCLGERFEVEVAWHASETEGPGQGVQLTADSGYFWFFGPNNIELVVKVLDGRAVNSHFWVFYGALTDVDYTILVRDTVTATQRVYRNPAGRFRSVADISAFF